MASKSRRVSNVNGAAIGPLKSVAYADLSKAAESSAVKSAPTQFKSTVNSILVAVKQFVADSDNHQLLIDAKLSDIMLGRIASLLDEVKESFIENELQQMKTEILDEISGISASSVLKSFLMSQISELFDNDATKEDIEDLKTWMQDNMQNGSAQSSQTPPTEEDVQKGDFKDSTIAENFYAVQTYVQKQFDVLNDNLKNIPGQSGMMASITSFVSKGFIGLIGKVVAVGKLVAQGTSKVFTGIGKIGSSLGKGLFAAVNGIAIGVASLGKGLKSVVSGIGSIGAKVGNAIATPFKAIGGFFSSLNPFKMKRDKKKEDKKQQLRDKIMEKITKLVDKIWTVIEPFIDIVLSFVKIAMIAVVIPIAIIMAQVLLIVGALVLIGIGLYLAYQWVSSKVKWFISYVKSGKLWKDIKAKIVAAWAWMKDFGKWIWQKLIDFGKMILKWYIAYLKFMFIDIPVWIGEKLAEFGIWIWDKLCEFGKWLYDNYIDKYLVQPFKQYIWEPVKKLWNEKIWPKIEPFVVSLTELKDKIVKAFSAWDTNKSIWENLKNIGGIIKDAVIEWWDNSPFKTFYEQNLKPFVESVKDLFSRLANLGGFIKDAILDWWNGDSSLGDTLKNIGSTLVNAVKEWWNGDNPIRKWYEANLKPKIDAIKQKLGSIEIKIPVIGTIRPFGLLVGKPAFENTMDQMKNNAKDFTSEKYQQAKENLKKIEEKLNNPNTGILEKAALKTQQLLLKGTVAAAEKFIDKSILDRKSIAQQQAQQQIQQAAQPIQQIESMQNDNQLNLQRSGQEISTSIQKDNAAKKARDDRQEQQSGKILSTLEKNLPEILDRLRDPAVLPIPVLRENNNDSAMMQAL